MSQDHFLNLQPGTIVNGRYEIVRCLGTGSMGMVYACRHRELSGHLVAMKVLFSEVARDEVSAARFRNEIVASYGVSHPNVIRAYEYFRDGDLIAFTMEYIENGDLADRITGDEPIPIDEIVSMFAQMCSGVQAIHDAGIVHRDLKPENILITKSGQIKITDFGIARTGTGPKLTEHGGVVGTLDYVSPEYLERGQVDARSDIYALGVLVYEMLTQEPPFKGKSVIETMTMRLRQDPNPPHLLRKDCPEALSAIVLRAMARDPEERYQSANDILQDLQSVGSFHVPMFSSAHHPTIQSAQLVQAEGETQAVAETVPEVQLEDIPDDLEHFPEEIPEANPAPNFFDEEEVPQSLFGSGSRHQRGLPHVDLPPLERESISVSQSHLSAQRIQELSQDLYPGRESLISTLMWWVVIIFVGFGVGFFVLRHYEPEMFSGRTKPVSEEIDPLLQ